MKLIKKSGAFYDYKGVKTQWKEKLVQALSEDKKLMDWLEKDIEQAITDMRTWKRILDDDSLEAVWDDIEASSNGIDDVIDNME